jgi:hypothetical protein
MKKCLTRHVAYLYNLIIDSSDFVYGRDRDPYSI